MMAEQVATYMANEIAETPEAVARLLDRERRTVEVLARRIADRTPTVFVTCARGSSDHAAGSFKYLAEILGGIPVASMGPSVASIYKAPLKLAGAVIVSVSQSGRSPDIVALQAAARQAGAFSIAVVNESASPLAEGADTVIPIHAGPERSVAATKSCVASAAALAWLVALWTNDAALLAAVANLPRVLEAALRADWECALPAFGAARSAYVVGRGSALPIAAEAALKLKETAALHAEAFSSAEVMHGPLQLLEPGFPVIAFRQPDASAQAMEASIERLRAARGSVFEVTAGGGEDDRLASAPTGHPLLDPLAMLLSFYAFAERLARARGHDPDRPSQLRKVTETV